MWRVRASTVLQLDKFNLALTTRIQNLSFNNSTAVQSQVCSRNTNTSISLLEPSFLDQNDSQAASQVSVHHLGSLKKLQIGKKISRNEKVDFLLKMLTNISDSKEDVYGTLDAWVALEKKFPISSLKRALINLEKEHQWHRVIQVIKWMLSKGQGNTMGTYGQLIQALDMDRRAEEAHMFWKKKIKTNLKSVPWELCSLMISVYFRNNKFELLTQLFMCLESLGRKPVEKSVVQKVADAWEIMGMLEKKEYVLQKYKYLFKNCRQRPL